MVEVAVVLVLVELDVVSVLRGCSSRGGSMKPFGREDW